MSPPRLAGRCHRYPKHTVRGHSSVHLPPPQHPSVSIPEAPYATAARLSLCHLPGNRASLHLISYLLSLQENLLLWHGKTWLSFIWFCSFCSTRDFQWSHSDIQTSYEAEMQEAPHYNHIIITHLPQDNFSQKNYVSLNTKLHLELFILSSFCGNDNRQLWLSFLRKKLRGRNGKAPGS